MKKIVFLFYLAEKESEREREEYGTHWGKIKYVTLFILSELSNLNSSAQVQNIWKTYESIFNLPSLGILQHSLERQEEVAGGSYKVNRLKCCD